jgi:hypothetical protein
MKFWSAYALYYLKVIFYALYLLSRSTPSFWVDLLWQSRFVRSSHLNWSVPQIRVDSSYCVMLYDRYKRKGRPPTHAVGARLHVSTVHVQFLCEVAGISIGRVCTERVNTPTVSRSVSRIFLRHIALFWKQVNFRRATAWIAKNVGRSPRAR